ncbi:MutS-related protein [Anaerolentibacter hominis]|uniref:MutS-related protein n=1 Tax=Anaerolentibacter hominis TaxID=3079009 RepID=UPI0031B8A0DE
MKFLLAALAVLLFLIIQSIIEAKRREKQLENRLLANWGEVPDEGYNDVKWEALKQFWLSKKASSAFIDDITWNDLELKELYMRMNATGCAMGEEYLYAMLRSPETDEDVLLEKDRLIEYFGEREDERLFLQKNFHQMGKLSKYSIYQYMNSELVEKDRTWFHWLCLFGLPASLFFCFVNAAVGIPLTAFFLFNNVFSYYKRKSVIEPYFQIFSYIIRMLNSLEKIDKKNIPILAGYQDSMRRCQRAFSSYKRGSFLVLSGGSMAGSIEDILMDYLRILFHIDLIKFNSMLKQLMAHRDEVNEMYRIIGLLDSSIAVASFRRQVDSFCKPVFAKDKGAYLNAVRIYHPYLDEPVANSICADKGVLVTGSNASGKSTFLKTIAINAVLAQTCYMVLADSYEASMFRIYSSMALRDDLLGGESYYMKEIRSLKRILDEAGQDGPPLLCFVDEVLRGTNTLERIAASSEIMKSLSRPDVLCFGATHDTELTQILSAYYDNYHFEEQVSDNDILFDYILHPGNSNEKNAILLLGIMGYDPKIIEHARENANYFLKEGSWRILQK